LLVSKTKKGRRNGNLGSRTTGSPTVFILDHCGFPADVFWPDDLCSRAATAHVAAQIQMDVAAAIAAGSAEKNGGGDFFTPRTLTDIMN
jgi:hypothetical protein